MQLKKYPPSYSALNLLKVLVRFGTTWCIPYDNLDIASMLRSNKSHISYFSNPNSESFIKTFMAKTKQTKTHWNTQTNKVKRPDGVIGCVASITLGPEIGPLRHIIEIHQNVPPINMYIKNGMIWNQWKIVGKMIENMNYYLIHGPKWPGNWTCEADIYHTSKSSEIEWSNGKW